MHIVFSKINLVVIHVLGMVSVVKNNQKIDDLNTLTSAICVSTLLPGTNISTQTTMINYDNYC